MIQGIGHNYMQKSDKTWLQEKLDRDGIGSHILKAASIKLVLDGASAKLRKQVKADVVQDHNDTTLGLVVVRIRAHHDDSYKAGIALIQDAINKYYRNGQVVATPSPKVLLRKNKTC